MKTICAYIYYDNKTGEAIAFKWAKNEWFYHIYLDGDGLVHSGSPEPTVECTMKKVKHSKALLFWGI